MWEYGIKPESICTVELESLLYRDDSVRVESLKLELADNINNGYETIVAVSNGRVYTFKLNSGENYNFYFCNIVNLAEKLFLAKDAGGRAFKGKLCQLSKRKAKQLANNIDLPATRNSLIGLLKSLKSDELGKLSYSELKAIPDHFALWVEAFQKEGNVASEIFARRVLSELD